MAICVAGLALIMGGIIMNGCGYVTTVKKCEAVEQSGYELGKLEGKLICTVQVLDAFQKCMAVCGGIK